MKHGNKNDVAYSSLELEPPTSPPPMRRNISGGGTAQISPNSSTVTIADTPGSSRSFFNHSLDASDARFPEAPHEFYRSVVLEILRAIEGPIQKLAFEIKGALVATGYDAEFAARGRLSEVGSHILNWAFVLLALRPSAICSRGFRPCSCRSSSRSSSCT
jgi:hypothetical protein